MKTIFLITTVIFVVNINAQIVNIPDANFKTYLVEHPLNSNNDSEIQVSEASVFGGYMDCRSRNISNLTGIEAFTSLTYLDCSVNQLTSLDVSQNTALTGLNCGSNIILTSIDVSGANSLTILDCSSNQLTSLDVSQNTALIDLFCYNNQLTSLDVSQNTALTGLYCSVNPLTSLDVSQNTALTDFFCFNNLLQCLNVKNGNNSNFTLFNATNNTNLNCIEVDDVAWSTSNWTSVDSGASFSTNCGNSCSVAGLEELSTSPKQLIKMIDLMGRETVFKANTPIINLYSDGTTERVFKFE